VRWFIFGVAFTMLPVFFKLVYGLNRKSEHVTFVWLFAGGELLLISVVIGCNALGRVFGINSSHPFVQMIAMAMCLLLVIISSFWFADISVAKSDASFNKMAVSYGSAILFGVNVIASLCCVCCII